MGLDMYFTARRYLRTYVEDSEDVKIAKMMKALFPELPESAELNTVEVEFGYWRKANAIHNWFVQNVQDGEDECKVSYVSREDIQKLLDTVNIVLNDHSQADVLLPTQEGFFFGGLEYGEYYFQCLEYTKEIMEKALDPAMKDWSFSYSSSW